MRIADVSSATVHNKRGGLLYRNGHTVTYHSIEAPKTISAAAALAMRGDKLAPKRGAPLVAAGVEATLLTVGVVSPFALDTFPRRELAREHTERRLFTSEGRLVVFRTPVWFVFSKQSTHCGKADWKVSVQEHLITSMNAPGLKRTALTLDKAVAACGQELMLE